MEFSAENFPLYQIILATSPAAETVRKDFEAAAKGGPAEKYSFAMGLFTVTQVSDIGKKVPAITSAIIATTKDQVYAIFSEGAKQGNADSALMAAFMKATAQGTAEDRDGAIALVDKAEKLGGQTPFSKELRKQLTPAMWVTKTSPGQ